VKELGVGIGNFGVGVGYFIFDSATLSAWVELVSWKLRCHF